MKHKVCYILPEYREDDATHFSYLGKLLEASSGELDIFLIILRGEKPKNDFGCTKVEFIGTPHPIIRKIKLRILTLRARREGYRDFYVHYSFLGAFCAAVTAKLFGGRVFYWNCGEPWKFHRAFFRERFERLVYKSITYLVTGSESLAKEYSVHYEIPREKIKIMPNWVDMERFQDVPDRNAPRRELGLPLDKQVIFFAHHLSSRKGARMILPVAREVMEKRKDVLFVVAGSGPDESMLRDRISNTAALKDTIRLVGNVPNREIQKYFIASDVFFMPSREEGFPRALLESMAAGLPSVSSNVGSVSEILPETMSRYIIPSTDDKGFIKAILELLSVESWQRLNMQKELRFRAAEFDTPKVAKKFIGLFQE